MEKPLTVDLRGAPRADAVGVSACHIPGCTCNDIAVVLFDPLGRPLCAGMVTPKVARDIAASLIKAATLHEERALARANNCAGRA
ncbi:MAG TPA: hypothetical protein PLW75_01520 [Hyphomicrobium sp.]|nr:hypothetical protein [Hyphomicrobium sp.]